MTPLQIGLTAGGIVVLIVVMRYNSWKERRSAPREAAPAGAPAEGDGEGSRVAPLLGVPGAAEPLSSLDGLIDSIVPLALERTPIAAEALLGVLPPTRRVGTKPFAVEARTAAGAWEFPRAGQRYDAVQAGVQLAGRMGALNDIEFSEFVVKVERMADALGASAEFPEMAHETARARELDQFARGYDAHLGLLVRANAAAWSAGFVMQQAMKRGFQATAVPGRMVLPAGSGVGHTILELRMDPGAAAPENFAEAPLGEVALGFDVPLIAPEDRPLEHLGQHTWALAEAMNGTVTDETGRALGADAMTGIAADLQRLYAALDEHGLPAGSPQAQRLFS
jgi:hypothetical protein